MKPSYVGFEIEKYQWSKDIDYRKHPELYQIGKGQQGVLICQPYKKEIGQYWRFKTPDIAKNSAEKIWQMFLKYLDEDDFVGADMAKKYLHMGFTRSRRYANHKTGKKWQNKDNKWEILPQEKDCLDNQKSKSAKIFYEYWVKSRTNSKYLKLKEIFISKQKV